MSVIRRQVEVPYEVPIPYEVRKEVRVPVVREVVKRVPREVPVEVRVPVIVERTIERTQPVHVTVPGPTETVERTLTVPRRVEREIPVTTIRKIPVPYPVERTVDRTVEVPYTVENVVKVPTERVVERTFTVPIDRTVEVEHVPRTIERTVRIPVDRIIERTVPIYVDRTVERVVHVPVTRVEEFTTERTVVRTVEKPVYINTTVKRMVETQVDRTVEVPRERTVERVVDRIVEDVIGKPVEKFVPFSVEKISPYRVEHTVEKTVEVPVTRTVERTVQVPVAVPGPVVNKTIFRDRVASFDSSPVPILRTHSPPPPLVIPPVLYNYEVAEMPTSPVAGFKWIPFNFSDYDQWHSHLHSTVLTPPIVESPTLISPVLQPTYSSFPAFPTFSMPTTSSSTFLPTYVDGGTTSLSTTFSSAPSYPFSVPLGQVSSSSATVQFPTTFTTNGPTLIAQTFPSDVPPIINSSPQQDVAGFNGLDLTSPVPPPAQPKVQKLPKSPEQLKGKAKMGPKLSGLPKVKTKTITKPLAPSAALD